MAPRSLQAFLSETCPHWDFEDENPDCDCDLEYTRSGERAQYEAHQMQRLLAAARAADVHLGAGLPLNAQANVQTILAILEITFQLRMED